MTNTEANNTQIILDLEKCSIEQLKEQLDRLRRFKDDLDLEASITVCCAILQSVIPNFHV
jgi:hypothetical protein